MASGILGSAQTASLVDTTVYTVPANKTAAVTISICNSSDFSGTLSYVGLTPNSSPSSSEIIEYNQYLDTGQVMERSGIVLGSNTKVVVKASAGLTVMVYGYEE